MVGDEGIYTSNTLTPCPSPLAKSTPGEGIALRRKIGCIAWAIIISYLIHLVTLQVKNCFILMLF